MTPVPIHQCNVQQQWQQHQHQHISFAVVTSIISKVVGVGSALTARVGMWVRRSWASAPYDSGTLYWRAAVLIAILTALRLSKRWCFGDGLYLRRRVLLLAQIKAFVRQWETQCLAEVEACCVDVDGQATRVLTPLIGTDAAASLVALWSDASKPSTSTLPRAAIGNTFYGVTTSIAFSTDLPLEEMLELAYVAEYVLYLDDDRAWLQRFVLLLQYVLLRRVSLMEEARLYAARCRDVLFPHRSRGNRCLSAFHPAGRTAMATFHFSSTWTQPSPLCAWRLHRRPTWLVSLAASKSHSSLLAGAAAYMCLPLSYFPVESVLPYTAAESWLNERLLDQLLPGWKRGCVRILKMGAASLSPSVASRGRGQTGMLRLSDCKISYWFLHYTVPLLHRQLQLHRTAARHFYTRKLYALAFHDTERNRRDKEGAAPHHLYLAEGGSLRLLARCAAGAFHRKRESEGGGDGALRGSPALHTGLQIRRALLLRAVSQGVTIILQVCFPHLSLRQLTEMAAPGFCVQSASSSAAADVTPSSPSSSATAAHTASTAVSSVDALLSSLAAQMMWATVAGVAEVLLLRLTASMGQQLSDVLSAEITAELQCTLLHVDEAFFRRWLRCASLEGGSSNSPAPPLPSQELRVGSAGSYPVQRPLCAEDVLSVGRRSGEKVMAVHDAVVKRWLRGSVLGLRAAFTRDWRPLLAAVVTTWVDVAQLTSWMSVRVGYSLPHSVARLLARRDESLPTRSPAGLRLLLEVLVEEAEAAHAVSHRASALKWRVTRREIATRFSCLPHPYLALVVCANVWSFDYLLGESRRDAEALATIVRGVRTLHNTVASCPFFEACGCPARALAWVAALQDDARCVAYYSLHQLEQQCGTPLTFSVSAVHGGASSGVRSLHPLLDAEETRLLQSPRAIAYLPEHVDYFDLFSLPYRFILRQLGLEMVFAYRTAMGMQQDSRRMAEEWWTLTLFNSSFNPLTSILREVMQLLASCGSVILLCTRVNGNGQVSFVPTPLTRLVQSSHTIDAYRGILRSGVALRRLEDAVSPIQQLCECLPCTIWSEHSFLSVAAAAAVVGVDGAADDEDDSTVRNGGAPLMHKGVSALQERRRQWRRHLARHRPELFFDRDDRIVGGLRLYHGVSWHHVYFCYPQLYRAAALSTCGEATMTIHPTLTDLCFTCPATGMTAIIGPSGSGKSSLSLLLRRLYDPVPVIHQQSQQGGGEGSGMGVSLSDIGLCEEADAVLNEVLSYALIDNALPPPPTDNLALLPLQGGCHGLSLRPGYLALDDIPICLFSSAYIRQWFAWLPQNPLILPQLSFLGNVSVLSPCVTLEDAQRALQISGCCDFIEDKHCTLYDKVGPVSGGEGQRLALARVVASVYARWRLEIIQSCDVAGAFVSSNCSDATVGGVVLDEPTSRLDGVNELRLLTSLTALHGGTAKETAAAAPSSPTPSFLSGQPDSASPPVLPLFTWMVSHRMSSLRSATFMVVVEGGAVTAVGPPREVLRNNVFAATQLQYQRLKGEMETGEEKTGTERDQRV
jgi:energy-coupling factor transporter ATP-binding protein EcfA2